MLKTKSEIKQWLDKMDVKNYTINDDLTVDVNGDVILFNKSLTEILIQFGVVIGSFACHNNKLTSLKGCPKIVKKDFYCTGNPYLTTLEYLPVILGICWCNNILCSTKEYKQYRILISLRK